jgi:hypothetical protein
MHWALGDQHPDTLRLAPNLTEGNHTLPTSALPQHRRPTILETARKGD